MVVGVRALLQEGRTYSYGDLQSAPHPPRHFRSRICCPVSVRTGPALAGGGWKGAGASAWKGGRVVQEADGIPCRSLPCVRRVREGAVLRCSRP